MLSSFSTIRSHPLVQAALAEFKLFLRGLRETFHHRLFDASSDFWAYHIGGLSVLGLFDLVLNYFLTPSYVWDYYYLSASIWLLCFFFAGPILRQHYKLANWELQPQTTILVKAVGCSIFFALLISLAASIIPMFFHYDDLYRFQNQRMSGVSDFSVITEQIFRSWFVTSFHLLSWMILYIGITSRRKTKQIEVANLRLQNSLKEAELSSLSNQLNPHFLFNALNNIRFMIHEDATNAEKMLMSLSSVLRYSLDSSKQISVALEQELEISNRYIDLVQVQFEERLQFTMNIPDLLLTCRLPPMVLQMLLENAVKHGIENIREGGKISVDAELKNNALMLTVINDLASDYQAADKEPGIGLLNIEQRLDLLYGAGASIEAGIEGKQYKVKVLVPQDQSQEN